MKATLTQVTNVIDQRTATDKHPGFATMIQQATHNMIEKVDHLMDASADNVSRFVFLVIVAFP